MIKFFHQIAKKFLIANLIIISLVMLSSCSLLSSDNGSYNEKRNHDAPMETLSDNTAISDFKINDNFINITEYTEINNSDFDLMKTNLLAYSGKTIILSYMNDDKLELYKLDDFGDDCNFIGKIDWNVMYNFLYQIVEDRYFIIMPSKNSNSGLLSTLYVYDMENNNFFEADSFLAYNIVQYITYIGNSTVAYFYYEAESKDWVIETYNLSDDTNKEIYRYQPTSENDFSPVGLTYNNENLVIALQFYNESEITETKFKEINVLGEEVAEYVLDDFPIQIIMELSYNGKYYSVCGNKNRTLREYSNIWIELSSDSYSTLIPLSAKLKVPTYLGSNKHLDKYVYVCDDYFDFAIADINNNSIQYFNIDTSDCNHVYTAVSNKNNDIAVIKYNDENYTFKLLTIKSENLH